MNYFKTNQTKISLEITNSMGKPFIQSFREVDTMIDRCNVMCEFSKEVLVEDVIKIDSKTMMKIKKEPVGISFLIAPWNYPLLTVINGLSASVLTGNPVLLKHSVKTPIIGDIFEEAFKSVGASNVLQHLFLDGPSINKVYKNTNVNFVGFTGSVETGKLVLNEIAQSNRFLNTGFELGGKDAAYIRDDADLTYAAESVVDGGTYNSGQSCCALERVYVHENIYDDFVGKLLKEINKITIGNPKGLLDHNKDELEQLYIDREYPSMGPMALPDSLVHLRNQVESAAELGAEILCGGNFTKDNKGLGRFFEPTLIVNCDNSMEIVREESFGPIIPVIKVSSDNEAIELINDNLYGLTASIYSKSYKEAGKMGEKLDVGTVFLNRCDAPNPALPWTGRKNSGVGVTLSKYGFNSFYKLKGYNFNII